jgi:hypothetical protein
MSSDPYVIVTCDRCETYTDELGLTALAGRGQYDERNLPADLARNGWRVEEDGHRHTCPDCQDEEEENAPPQT